MMRLLLAGLLRGCLAGPALLGAAGASAAVEVPVEIDLRAEIAAGRFDPARDAAASRPCRGSARCPPSRAATGAGA
jgi:hypothetical protein